MAKPYNPMEHSIVQALLKADGCNAFEVERYGYVDALVRAIILKLGVVYSNAKQESLDDRSDWQFLEIPGFEYRRYFWGDCDCGADSPSHDQQCIQITGHEAWNERRLEAISDPAPITKLTTEEKARMDLCQLVFACARNIRMEESAEWEARNPRPICNCGATGAWSPRDYHLATCSPKLPNLKFGEVVINWYKYPGRGSSTNVDWAESQWREWYDAVIATLDRYDPKGRP